MSSENPFALALRERLRSANRRPSIYGYIPHSKQQDFHSSTAKGRIFIGGNRSGKTVGGANELLRAACGIDPFGKFPEPPLRLRAVTVDLKQGIEKIIVPELARWTPPSQLINGSWEDSFNKSRFTLTLNNESFIELLTYEMDVEKHAGTSRHAVWFDEEPPEEIFNENMARLVDTGGRWWITMTPVEGLEWIFQLYHEVVVEGNPQNKDVYIVQVDSYENPHIAAAEIDSLFINLSPERRLARTRGMFEDLGGKIYPMFSESNILDLPESWTIPSSWVRINGMDHGFRNPTAWLFAAVNPDENEIIIYDEYYESGRIVQEHARHIVAREYLFGPPRYRVGDPAIKATDAVTGTSIQYEYAKNNIFIALGNNDVKAGIDRVASLLTPDKTGRPRLFIARHCHNLISELRKYRWASYAHAKMNATRNKKEEPVKKDDHACDALRYLVSAWHEWRDSPPESDLGLVLGPKALRNTGEPTALEWESEVGENQLGGSPLGEMW